MLSILIGKMGENGMFVIEKAYTKEKGFVTDPEYTNLAYLRSVGRNYFAPSMGYPLTETEIDQKLEEINNEENFSRILLPESIRTVCPKGKLIAVYYEPIDNKIFKINGDSNYYVELNDDYESDPLLKDRFDAAIGKLFEIKVNDVPAGTEVPVHSITEYLQYVYSKRDNGYSTSNGYMWDIIDYNRTSPSEDAYSDKNAEIFYLCNYAYAYSFLYSECFMKILETGKWPEDYPMHVMSFGCGPCLDGYGLKYAEYKCKRKGIVASYIGVDGANWGDNGFCFKFDNSESESTFVRKYAVEYMEEFNSIDANVFVFPYFLSELTDAYYDRLLNQLDKIAYDDIRIVFTVRLGGDALRKDTIRLIQMIYYLTGRVEENLYREYVGIEIKNSHDNNYKAISIDEIKAELNLNTTTVARKLYTVDDSKTEEVNHKTDGDMYLYKDHNYVNFPPNIYAENLKMFDRSPIVGDRYLHYFIYSLHRD